MVKQKRKNNQKKNFKAVLKTPLTARQSILSLFVLGVVSVGAAVTPFARADQFDAQISQLQQQNSVTSSNLAQLGSEAATLQDEVSKLQAQINDLQAKIQANQAKNDDLQRQITQAEADLDKQKKILGENIKTMYLEGQISTLEMLASSKDLSDFVDKQQYRSAVQDKIKTTLDTINQLKAQLKDQQQQVQDLLKDEQAMQSQLDSQRAYQASLLSANQSQQATLNQQIQDNNAKVASLRAQQLAAIAAASRSYSIQNLTSTGHGGYPDIWANASQDTLVDDWGMYNRECVSYAAFRVAASGRNMPYWGGAGNANQWPGNAQAAGIPVDSHPTVGSVMIMYIGPYGHAAYVEQVLNNGSQVLVSQYNWVHGQYSQMIISTSGLLFIHF